MGGDIEVSEEVGIGTGWEEALEVVIEQSDLVDSFLLAAGLRPADAVHDQSQSTASTAGGIFYSPAGESSGNLAPMQRGNASSSSGSSGCRGVGSSAFGKAVVLSSK